MDKQETPIIYGKEPYEDAGAKTAIAKITIIVMIVSVAISTVVHHLFPSVLDVPSLEGIPMSSMPQMFILDLLTIGMGWLCFRHAWKRLGLFMALAFLGGSFIYTGIEESMWILLGRFGTEVMTEIPGAGPGVAPSKTAPITLPRDFSGLSRLP